MKYGAEMGSGAVMYIPSFMKTDSGVQKLMEGGGLGDTQTHRCWRSHKPTFVLSK
jgi:hypothetical protein